MSKQTHTKTPWRVNKFEGQHKDGYTIFDCGGFLNMDEDKANARHIVKCVNSHDELVEALKKALYTLNQIPDTKLKNNVVQGFKNSYEVCNYIEQALQKAEIEE